MLSCFFPLKKRHTSGWRDHRREHRKDHHATVACGNVTYVVCSRFEHRFILLCKLRRRELARAAVRPTHSSQSFLQVSSLSSCNRRTQAIENLLIDHGAHATQCIPIDIGVTVTATSATGETMVDMLNVFGLSTLVEWGSPVNITSDDGKTRTTVITDPPSDLVLNWDPSLMGAEAIHVTLAKVVGDDEIEDVAVIGEQSNTGSFVASMDVLGGIELQNDTYVMFKVVAMHSIIVKH